MKITSLFSGIGAYEKALKNLNIDFELVNYCEIDGKTSKAYSILYDEPESKNLGDITKVNLDDVKEVDLLFYSPPCQSFSIAGNKLGVEDERGILFFNALKIIEKANPKILIMENVDNLPKKFSKEFNVMLHSLENIGYNNYWQVINALDFIPQNRKRVFIVSIRKDLDNGDFKFPIGKDKRSWWDLISIDNTRECTNRQKQLIEKVKSGGDFKTEGNIDFTRSIISVRQSGVRFSQNSYMTTLCAAMGKGGGNFPIISMDGRYGGLTPKMCFKLMGFTEDDCEKLSKNKISNSALYTMAGNSVVVPVIEAILKELNIKEI